MFLWIQLEPLGIMWAILQMKDPLRWHEPMVLDISAQKCRRFERLDFQEFDYIFAMDQSNYSNIVALANNPEDESKVKLLLDEVDLGINEVPDPYYGGVEGFEYVYGLIDKACEAIAKNLR